MKNFLNKKVIVIAFWDNFGLFLAFLGVGFLAHMQVEEFKNSLVERHYYLEKHETHLEQVARIYDSMATRLYKLTWTSKTKENKKRIDELRRHYIRDLDRLKSEINAHGRYYGDDFSNYLQLHIYFNHAIAYDGIVVTPDHSDFTESVLDHFGNLMKHAKSGEKITLSTEFTNQSYFPTDLTHEVVRQYIKTEKKSGSIMVFNKLYESHREDTEKAPTE